MMKKSVLAIDYDITTFPTEIYWFDYLNKLSGMPYKSFNDLPKVFGYLDYNFHHYFPMLTKEEVQSFWYKKDLYDGLKPLDGALDFFSSLNPDKFELVWVSLCEPAHQKSKENSIKTEIMNKIDPKFEYNFVSTDKKGFIDCDYFIDDRIKHILQFGKKRTATIWMDRKFTQTDYDATIDISGYRVESWYDIKNLIK